MNDAKLLGVFRVCLMVCVLLVLVWLLCGCVTYYRHVWTPADLRDGDVAIVREEPKRLVVTEGYVYWLYKSYGEARLLSLLIRENEDGTWVIRKER